MSAPEAPLGGKKAPFGNKKAAPLPKKTPQSMSRGKTPAGSASAQVNMQAGSTEKKENKPEEIQKAEKEEKQAGRKAESPPGQKRARATIDAVLAKMPSTSRWQPIAAMRAMVCLHGQVTDERILDQFEETLHGLRSITPAALQDALQHLGLGVALEDKPDAALCEESLPALFECEDGNCVIVTGIYGQGISLWTQARKTLDVGLSRKEKKALKGGLRLTPILAAEDQGEKQKSSLKDAERERNEKAAAMQRHLRVKCFEVGGKLIATSIMAAAMSNLFLLVTPIFMIIAYDRVVPHLALATLWVISFGALAALSMDFFCRRVRAKLQDALAVRLSGDMQRTIVHAGLRRPWLAAPAYMRNFFHVSRDLNGVCAAQVNFFVSALADLPFFFLLVLFIVSFAKWVALAPLAGLLVMAGVYLWLSHAKPDAPMQLHGWMMSKNKLVEKFADIVSVAIPMNAGPLLSERFEKTLDQADLLEHQQRMQAQIFAFLAMVLGQMAIIVGIIIAVYQVSAGSMATAALAGSALLIGRLTAMLTQFFSSALRLRLSAGTLSRAHDLLEAAAGKAAPEYHRIALEKVPLLELHEASWVFPGCEKATINAASLALKPGTHIGILGPMAAGKSALLGLLAGLAVPQKGLLRVDSHNACQIDPQHLRRVIGFLPQQPAFVQDTILENIKFGMHDVDEALLEQVLDITGLALLLRDKPLGLGFGVAPDGANLSFGEKQLLCLARCLLRRFPVLLLDEPLGMLGEVYQRRIMVKLRAFLEGRTLVVASSHSASIACMPSLVVLNRGHLVMQGPAQTIMTKLRATGVKSTAI